MHTRNPATAAIIRELTLHSDDQVQERLDSAQQAFTHWKERSFGERADHFVTLAALLRERKERFAQRMTEEMGKPIAQARSEAEKCAWVCEYFAEHAATFLEPQPVDTDAEYSHVEYAPLGPILAIMPWNFPFWQVFRFAAPTLMAGNVALLKHARNVTGCAEDISELFQDAGFPDGVFDHLVIDVETTTDLLEHRAIRGAALTGSVGAGRSVGAAAGRSLKPCVLELGGSDPFIVLEDCDLDRAIEVGTFARMMNNGQSCIAAKRFIVEDSIYDQFVDRFQTAIEELTVGDPTDEDTDVGPMARQDLRESLHRQVTETIDAGARCLVGGEPVDGHGFYYKPTLLTDVTDDMVAFTEETFGPVATVTRAENAGQAIALANDTTFGLGASIWTTSDRGQRLAAQIEAGSVFVNEMVKSDPRLPFGGIKDSGIGRELSSFGIKEFVNVKTVYIR